MKTLEEEVDIDIYFMKERDKRYRTPWNIKIDILQSLSDSCIAELMKDKILERKEYEQEIKVLLSPYRWYPRKLLEIFLKEELSQINKTITEFDFHLRMRRWEVRDQVNIDSLKQNISILDLIEYTWWWKINPRNLIKCPFPSHDDSTPSLKVYVHTNTFYCQWCKRWWSTIDFIKGMYSCDTREAIKKLTSIYK